MKKIYTVTILASFLFSSCAHKKPDLEQLRQLHAQYEQYYLNEKAKLVERALSLDEIIEIALENNLELYAHTYEIAAQNERTKSEALKMLPDLNLNSRAANRTQNTAAFSQSLIPGVPPAPLSISRESYIETANLNLSWNLVDFGISYFRSRQANNNTTVRIFDYERIRNKLILDLTSNYWRAVAGKKAVDDMDELLTRTESERSKIRKQVQKKLTSEIPGLTAEDKLAEAEVGMLKFKRIYHESINELKRLMGVPPQAQLDILVPDNLFDEISVAPYEELERVALLNRNELFDKDLREIITADGMNEVLVQMIPGFSLFAGPQYDSNFFLLNSNWVDTGIQLAWNLLKLPARAKQHKSLSNQKDKITVERMQMALAVLTQVHISKLLVDDYAEAYQASKNFYNARNSLYKAVKKQVRLGESYEGYALAFEARAYIAQLEMLSAYANFRTGIETLNNAIGLPLHYGSNQENNTCACYLP